LVTEGFDEPEFVLASHIPAVLEHFPDLSLAEYARGMELAWKVKLADIIEQTALEATKAEEG
jgi:hypothetical protein